MRGRVVLALLVPVVLLVSAGHGAPPAGADAGSPPVVAPEPAGSQEPVPVRIAVPQRGNLQFLNLWVALGAGLFEDEGLDVELVVPPMPGQTTQLLLQGQADVAALMPPLFLGAIAREQPVRLFANLLTNDPINLVVDRDVAEELELSPDMDLADKLEALQGRRIGVAPQPVRRLRVLFESVGMDADEDVEIVETHGPDQLAALASGAVDALYTHTPFLEAALVDQEAMLLVDQSGGEVPELAGLQIHAMVTTPSEIRQDPGALVSVTRAVYEAQQLIRSDQEAAVQALLDAGIPDLDPARVEALVGVYDGAVPRFPIVPPDGVVRAAELFPARPEAPDFDEIDVRDHIASWIAWWVVLTDHLGSDATAPVPPELAE